MNGPPQQSLRPSPRHRHGPSPTRGRSLLLGPFLVAWAACLHVSVVWAQERSTPSGVTWEAPARCGEVDAFLERLDAAVDGVGTHPAAATWSVSVAVSEGTPLVVSVRTRVLGVEGERDVTADDCAAAVDAAVLVVALALAEAEPDPDVIFEGPPPASVEPPVAEAEPLRAPDRSVPEEAPRSDRTGWWLGAAGGVGAGPMPDAAGVVSLRVDFASEAWRVGIGVRGYPHGAVLVAGEPASITLGTVALSPRGCLEAHVAVLALGACAELDAGVLVAAASGLDAGQTTALPWLSVGLAASLALALESVRVELQGGAFGTPTRPRLTIGSELVHQPDAVEGWGTLGLAVQIDVTRGDG